MKIIFGKIKQNKLIIILLILSFLVRVYRLDEPRGQIFDEFYHAYTAKMYITDPKEAWNWRGRMISIDQSGGKSWDHPPLAKEIMAGSMILINSFDPIAYRFPSVLMGVLSIFIVYKVGKSLFKNTNIALIAAYLFSLDSLNFVLSRTGMLDIYLLTFILLSLFFFLENRLIISTIFLGFAIGTKWSGICLLLFYLLYTLFIKNKFKNITQIILLFLICLTIYIITFLPFFLEGHNINEFLTYQQDMFLNQINYHQDIFNIHFHQTEITNNSSNWYDWLVNKPLLLYPDPKIYLSNQRIYAILNPFLLLTTFVSLIYFLYNWIQNKQKEENLFFLIVGIVSFLIPWFFIHRNIFFYYVNLEVPFFCLLSGYFIYKIRSFIKSKVIFISLLTIPFLFFIFYYPFLTALPISLKYLNFFIPI